MRRAHLVVLGTPAVLCLAATAWSFAQGSLPGTSAPPLWPNPVPIDVARVAPSCGFCHTMPATFNVAVTVAPTQRSLNLNQSTALTISGSGGSTGSWGGFVADATRGTFVAGTTTLVDATGKFITHKRSFYGRSWTFNYTAPSTAGLVEMYVAVNTANDSGTPEGETWGFHGDPTATAAVPVRLYANAANVTNRGVGCVGSFGNWSVLGSKQVPSIGNAAFGFELFGAAPSSAAVLFLGFNPAFQVSLNPIGVTGCTLYAQPDLNLVAATSPGMPSRGDGSATFALPLPANPFLQGFTLQVQAAYLDPASGRRTPFSLSNALSFTIQ